MGDPERLYHLCSHPSALDPHNVNAGVGLTPWIYLRPVQLQSLSAVDRHGCEGLADLYHAFDFELRDLQLLKQLGYGVKLSVIVPVRRRITIPIPGGCP